MEFLSGMEAVRVDVLTGGVEAAVAHRKGEREEIGVECLLG